MVIISFSTAILIDFKVILLQAKSQAALPTFWSVALGAVARNLDSLHRAAVLLYSVQCRHDEKSNYEHSPEILAKQVTKTLAGKH